jgi:hypothetical protein
MVQLVQLVQLVRVVLVTPSHCPSRCARATLVVVGRSPLPARRAKQKDPPGVGGLRDELDSSR